MSLTSSPLIIFYKIFEVRVILMFISSISKQPTTEPFGDLLIPTIYFILAVKYNIMGPKFMRNLILT